MRHGRLRQEFHASVEGFNLRHQGDDVAVSVDRVGRD
jgi:hypothetical protein